jgi:hypothetical protein
MEELVGLTLGGDIVKFKEGDSIGEDGVIEVITPDFSNGIHRAFVRRKNNSIGVVRIFESSFVYLDTKGNGKGYNDYPQDVREKAKLFTKQERGQMRQQELKNQQTGTLPQQGRSF